MTELREYAFDVKLLAAIRVKAASEQEARKMLTDALNCADTNFGAWPNGDPITAEASMDGDADLFEVDGEDPDAGEWSGSPCPDDPDNFWICDKTGARIPA